MVQPTPPLVMQLETIATLCFKWRGGLSADFRQGSSGQHGSIRVLQKCGFEIIGKNKDFANGRGEVTEEYILRLDLDQAMNESA